MKKDGFSPEAELRIRARADNAESVLRSRLTRFWSVDSYTDEALAIWQSIFSEWACSMIDAVASEAVTRTWLTPGDLKRWLRYSVADPLLDRVFALDTSWRQLVLDTAIAAGFEPSLEQVASKYPPIPTIKEAIKGRIHFWADSLRAAGADVDFVASSAITAQRRRGPVMELDPVPLPAAWAWESVHLRFTSDERITIEVADLRQTRNYEDFGCCDWRSGKPNKLWQLLRLFAERGGVFLRTDFTTVQWAVMKKTIQRLRDLLKKMFRTAENPIVTRPDGGYRLRAHITLAPASDF
jgi:hypothetical protein